MKIKKHTNGNVILIDGNDKEISKVPSEWLLGRDLRNSPMYFYASPSGSNGGGVVIDHSKVTHIIKDDVETEWTGNADELFSELVNDFFFKVSRGGSTNALFNVKDYGAKGDGIKDDTQAFKNCFAAAILAKGKVIIPAPNNNGFYKITSTITVKHPTNNECYLDVEGYGVPRSQIRYSGASGTSCFKLIGLRFSTWTGVKLAMGNNTNTTAVELDTIAPTSSTSFLTFTNCQVALGSGTGQVGWKIGLLSENGGDLSCLLWQNCSVFGANRDTVGQIGWSIRGSNTLHNVWVQCFGAFLNTMVSNKDGGNGANYFYGMGTSQNNLDFYIQNTSNWIIEGGRYELGRQLLDIGYDNKSPSIILKGLAIGSYDGINGKLIVSDMPCSIEMSGVQVGKKFTEEWGPGTIMLYGGQYGPTVGKGRFIHDGGSITTTQPDYITKGNATEWLIYRRAVGKMNNDGVVADIFTDLSGG